MATRSRQEPASAPTGKLAPSLARIVSGTFGTESMFQRPLLRIVKIQGISMIAGPRTNPEDETEPQEGDTLFAYRLFLTDDQYVVAAVLDPVLHPLVHDKILTGPGTYVTLTDFDVRTSPKKAATGKFTRFLKVRKLDVAYSPGIQFHPENADADGDYVMSGNGQTIARPRTPHREIQGIPEDEEEEEEDEVVVIKQEAASSQLTADFGLDGTRDREIDDDESDYGLDADEEEDLSQLEPRGYVPMGSQDSTPDSFATADERPQSPDDMFDELDDFTEEEISFLVEPKVAMKREVIDSTCKSVQKQKIAEEEKLRMGGEMGGKGLRNSTKNTNYLLGVQPAQKVAQPLYYGKENSWAEGASSEASSSQGISRYSSPLPRQDRGLSPGPPTNTTPFSMGPSSPVPLTPQKPLRQPQPFSSPSFRSPPPQQQQPRPIVLTKLGDLTKMPLKSKVDVLAIIDSIDDKTITRSIGIKRDMHLLDPTVNRSVWLSVWVDAAIFKPPRGSLVLFRGLTVHKFDTRSLNAFSEVANMVWHIIEPTEEMAPGANEMREWWRRKTVEETFRNFGVSDEY
ncbi:hypothetical protein TWF730_007218 [Orbilia blumenaviensis]|uniref:Replication protein A OB domain-containing protein n=1 Tax=Orbilia blumenaviensis TaxID=1796055 RepID=A0AAV9VAE7_9PEZI